ncbi:MAG: nicotinate-nucleotide adenylyltransferase [Gammaproteobacteria bacterium]|nr:nicotinate-nucleotide adenylyltransferase [Gammaproteobacteria bacterium]
MIGILGGTFDPVHHGHLRLAVEIRERLELTEMRLIPAARPPHRGSPAVNADMRLAMLRAAVRDTKGLTVDDRELRRIGPSYMADTLAELRAEYADTPLCFVLGMDAFRELPSWHAWESLITLAHLVVAYRPNANMALGDTMRDFVSVYRTQAPRLLRRQPFGAVFMQEIPALAISATEIRASLATGKEPRYLLPDAVLRIIRANRLYE